MRRSGCMALMGLGIFILPASADEVTLRNGRTIVGIAQEEGEKIKVEIGIGTVWFPRDEVVAIQRGETPLHVYRSRLEAIRERRDPDDLVRLARWCASENIPRYIPELLGRALEIAPDHEDARRMAGYTKVDGKWLTQDEIKKSEGYVLFEGKWLHPLEIELLHKQRLEAQEKKLEAERERRERDAARRREREMSLLRSEPRIPFEFMRPRPLGRLARPYDWDRGLLDLMVVDWLFGGGFGFGPLTR
ncbi:MAG: hypothetical protein HY716_00435 [Planctomycetes bacterium]|nr:hypothetical protein [Planctomycetota bacterium]